MSSAWEKEAEKHATGGRQNFSDIRDLQFKDDSKFNVRILPEKNKDAVPFVGYSIHWIPQQNSKKGRPIVHSIDKRCAVDEYVADLWGEINRLKEEDDLADNHPKVKAIQDKISAVKAHQKYDFNIIDRDDLMHEINGKKQPACKRLVAPWTVWKTIFEYAKNPKWGNPSDEKNGYDLEISIEGEGARRNYSVVADRNASPLTDEEKAILKSSYDLDKLRIKTSSKDIAEILQNAKPPFDEILRYLTNNETEQPTRHQVKAVSEKHEEHEEQKDTEEESVKQEEKEEIKKQVVEETENEETKVDESESSDGEDPNNINSYECKGEFEEKEALCRECPVKEKCVEFQPIYNQSKEWNLKQTDADLKIDLSPSRTIEQITSDFKKKNSIEDSTPKLGKKRKNIPF